MVDVLLAIGYICLSFCCWEQSRIQKRQQLEIKELKKYIHYNWMTEDRCDQCKIQHECPAYNTAVIYPCPHFCEEESHGKQE